jgi:tryptophan synthase alpha chain
MKEAAMSRPLMCHVVAGYPDAETCLRLMKGLQEAGAAAIEVQIPFSDPIADGETIMRANDTALEAGMTTAGSFDLMEEARRQGVDSDIYIMSYVQKVLHFGFEEFCVRAKQAGAKGLIIPDLPHESPEYDRLAPFASSNGLELVPVLSPGMPEDRLAVLLKAAPGHVYVTSQRGITGNEYTGTEELKRLVSHIRQQSKALVMIGFGIATPQDVSHVLEIGDVAVVGSAIIKHLQGSDVAKTIGYVKGLAEAKP